MRSILLDASGQIRELNALTLSQLVDGPEHGVPLLDHAIRTAGLIAVDETEDCLRIRWSPQKASPIAFSALCYHLADRNPARIAIMWLDGVWKYGIFGSLKAAICHLAHLFPAARDRMGDFISRPRSLTNVDFLNPIAALVGLWQRWQPTVPHECLGQLLAYGLRGRYVIVQGDEDRNVYFREVGCGFPWIDKEWASRAKGLRMQDQPDYHLGGWAATAYRKTMVSGEPRLEDIDAVTSAPNRSPRRIRYTRLIVPIALPGGDRGLLGASMLNSDIDLRGVRSRADAHGSAR